MPKVRIITKEELTQIIDGLLTQTIWVNLCIEVLEYLGSIEKERLENSRNFWYITQTSLIYRYSMELAKLFDEEKGLSIKRIKNLCSNNSGMFNDPDFIIEYCRAFGKELDNYSDLCKNFKGRRNKTYAHNDQDYYLFDQKAIIDFPLDFEKIKKVSVLIYTFAEKMHECIGSEKKKYKYPIYSDDVKRLFGEKTEVDIALDEPW